MGSSWPGLQHIASSTAVLGGLLAEVTQLGVAEQVEG